MRLRLQLQLLICCVSALWVLASARSCSYASNVFSSMSNTGVNGQRTAPSGRIFDQLTAGMKAVFFFFIKFELFTTLCCCINIC